jgi:AcrR family transcriptional regulator
MPTRRRTPKQERSQATVDAIVEAAARLLAEEGYARLSTSRVAERAGVSVGTLYQYFRSKEAIVEALVHRLAEERIAQFGATLASLVEQDPPLEDGIRVLLDATLAAMRVRPELARRLLIEAPRSGRTDLEHAWRRRVIELVRAVLHRRRDQVRDAADLELVAWLVVTAGFAVLQDANAYRPELLEGDLLRDELTRLAHGYLSIARTG